MRSVPLWFIVTFSLLALLFPHQKAWAFNSHDPFDISADILDYEEAEQRLTADGHVVVVQGTSTLSADHMRYDRSFQQLWAEGHVILKDNGHVVVVQGTSTLSADHMRYDRSSQQLWAEGHVILKDKGSFFLGDQLDYDLAQRKGTILSGKGFQSPWLFQGHQWEKQRDAYLGRSVSFTTCDLIDPHYHIRSSRLRLVPDQHFWAWNNWAYADTLPVFYSPFIYRNLGKRRMVVQIRPGHDDVNGNFVKTITTVRLTDFIYDRILWDYYSLQGNGLGNEFTYKSSDKIKGSLFGYYINPKGNPQLAGAPQDVQYNIRSYHWQRVNPTVIFQTNANIRKNVSFNNQYFPQDFNQSITDLPSSMALTQQTKRINHRIVLERLDAPDPGDTTTFATTHVQTASLPRYDFTLFQMPLWKVISSTSTGNATKPGPLLFSMNASAGNSYSRRDDRIRTNASSAFTFTQSIPLSKDWTLTPSLIPQMKWQDKFDPPPTLPTGSIPTVTSVGLFRGAQGRFGASDTLRWRPRSSLTFDQIYSLTERLEPNGTHLDRGFNDGGVETHHLTSLLFWRPSRRVLLRTFSGYDLRQIANEDPDVYLQRVWDPWTAELTLQARSNLEYFFRHQLAYYPVRTNLWEASFRYWGSYRTLLETGLLYNRGLPGLVTWNNRIGLYASPGWRVDTTFHARVPTTRLDAVQKAFFIDTEVALTRDLHCWEAQFIYRNRPPFSREYSILFSLKLGASAEKKIADRDLEAQFYPWRADPYVP